jgi:hypothetical protein
MKIRIKDNSIRLRLTRSEVSGFGQTGMVEAHTSLPESTFTYALKSKPDGPEENLHATFDNQTITLFMPESMKNKWTSTDLIGCESIIKTENGTSLFLLIEKDFKCLDETHEDQSDQYDHPLISQQAS